MDLGQHWLRKWLLAWRHQAVTWMDVDLSSVRSHGVHLRVLSYEDLKILISKTKLNMIFLKLNMIFLKSHPDLLGTNELIRYVNGLTHWGRVTHICASKVTIVCSDNGLSPGRRQAIIWTNAGILLIGTLGTNFSEIWIEIRPFSFKKMHLKMSSGKWWPFCLGLNVLIPPYMT